MAQREFYSYDRLIDDFVTKINSHTIALYSEKDFSEGRCHWNKDTGQVVGAEGLGWSVNIFLDCCHSGSALKAGIKWTKKHGSDSAYSPSETYSCDSVKFFEKKVYLCLEIITSASEKEVALDAGEGKGGRWTNHYFAKGRQPSDGDRGRVIEGVGAPGKEPPTQTTCAFVLDVYQKE